MTPLSIKKRLAAVEAQIIAAPVYRTTEERAAAARRYELTLYEPDEPDPRAEAYWATASLKQLADDYAVICRGGPAPWE